LAILALITFRPEFEPSWAGLANVGALSLQRLGRRDVQVIVAGVADGRTLPSEVMEQIVSKADRAFAASQIITSGMTALQVTGARFWKPLSFVCLTSSYAELGQFDDAWRCITEAIDAVERNEERWWEAEVHRVARETALASPNPDVVKAETHFENALAVARKQQAKSFELRAAVSMVRLWRDQGRTQQALELLTPVYGWFTEGLDTRDLKDAKALLEELQSAQGALAARC
jgi:predicted ATPase